VGKSCTPTTVQYVPNTRALSVAGLTQALKEGTATWFFITADYAFGNALQKDATAIIEANGGKVLGAAWLHEHPVDDIITRAAVRPDGRVMNDLYVVQVKTPGEITDPLDNLKVLARLQADALYPGPSESACPLFRH
jgi:hypothetical protein